MKELTEKDIEQIVERVLREKGLLGIPQNVTTKDDILLLKDDVKLLKNDLRLMIELMNNRFEDLIHFFDKRFEAIEKRFDEVNKRINLIIAIMFTFNIPILVGILALILKVFIP